MVAHLFLLALLTQVINIDGQVRDAGLHSGLTNARIELQDADGTREVRFSDADGHFEFQSIGKGHYWISVTHAGYQPGTLALQQLNSTGRIEIDLIPAVRTERDAATIVSAREYQVPPSARKLFDRARREMKKDCRRAVTDLESGLRIFDRDGLAYNSLGNCQRQMGNLDAAEESFKRAVSLTDDAYVALNLAEVYTAEKNYLDAEKVLKAAIRKSPQNGDILYGLAAAYFQEGRIDEAENAARQAHDHIHTIPDVHLLLAKIYDRKQDQQSVIEQLKMYLKEAHAGPQAERIRKALKSN